MNKSLLLIVTGRPASGKSTLARLLTTKIKCPLLSRDALKEGFINTIGNEHNDASNSVVTKHIYETFFQVTEILISQGISIIIEAAFQDKLWKPKLTSLLDKAEIKIIICKTTAELTKKRFNDRLLNDPDRDRFHRDSLLKEQGGLATETYEPVHMNVPTLEVDTSEGYDPTIENIIAFITQK